MFTSENLYGKPIKLTINHYKNKQRCAEILLQTTTKQHFKHKAIITCLVAALNLLIFHFSLTNPSLYLLVFVGITCTILNLLFKVKNEKLLIIKSLGVQFTIEYYMGCSRTQFIPWSEINRVFINEIITQQKVLYVLTITTKQEETETLIPLFQNIKPRLKCLEIIYREVVTTFQISFCKYRS